MSDSALIEALKNGEPQALKSVYVSNRLAFIHFAKKYPISNETIFDIYQDAIIAFRNNVVNGHADELKSELRTYLFSIGKYMIYNKIKSQHKIVNVDILNSLPENETYSDIHFHHQKSSLTHEQQKLQKAYKNLGQKCKEVLTLFYYRGFTIDEIRGKLNYASNDVVKSQKSRCLKQIKDLIIK